ncbi:hypothetical protein BV22DRAFT_1113934 [Leucogyrophana mollusca]|uniref:Uncharacterized protein n=1 Tax=Leucogyrophana mollusca TaxID=85980 RepID=A0ACB8B9D8_9AGAM|nr:hypothetical protein BV22DRAFT_1113934 [Leucogyrophana mollusca]
MTSITDPSRIPALDERFYSLDAEELEFFKSQTGIDNDEQLKTHIVDVQAKAHEIHPYHCIRRFAFTKLKISRLPAYSRVIEIGRERDDAILLDVGCCFGNDVRKAAADGFPISNILALDLRPEFWELGHELFKSSPDTFPVPFIGGDIFDPAILEVVSPDYRPMTQTLTPALTSLTSLNPLRGRVSIIHASSMFHLFDEKQQLHLARALGSLLSQQPGSVIFGVHGSMPETGILPSAPNSHGQPLFCHNPDSWRALWDGGVFARESVCVETELREVSRGDMAVITGPNAKFWVLIWSVTRI